MRERHVHQLIVRHKVMFVVQSATGPLTFNFQWKTELCFFLSDFNSDNVYHICTHKPAISLHDFEAQFYFHMHACCHVSL